SMQIRNWLSVCGSRRGLSLRRSLVHSRSSHSISPLIAELLYVYSSRKDSIDFNCCLVLLTTFSYKGTYLHLSLEVSG
ncbi:mCG1045625, partial [Mus musculus]